MRTVVRLLACLVLAASVFVVPGPAQAAATGRIAGRLMDHDWPVVNSGVQVRNVTTGDWVASTQTDRTGAFTVTVPPGRYKVEFPNLRNGVSQWARGVLTESAATVYTVRAGRETTVNDTVVPGTAGRLAVTATDSVTGEPIQRFCAHAQAERPWTMEYACTEDGVVRLRNLAPHPTQVTVSGGTSHFAAAPLSYTPVSGGLGTVRVSLRPGGSARAVVRDTAGNPVETACIQLDRVVPDHQGAQGCTDAAGVTVMGPLEAGTYTAYVDPQGDVLGTQYVGTHGGTGDRAAAHRTTVEQGVTADLPPIVLDPAGTITGTVTDAVTGNPVRWVCAARHWAEVDYTLGRRCTDDNGRYTLSGAGPYAWPLQFAHRSGAYAWTWSGGAASRLTAVPVRVQAGETAVADTALTATGMFSGKFIDNHGNRGSEYTVRVFDAVTGDLAGKAGLSDVYDYDYAAAGLTGRAVKIQYESAGVVRWYTDAADFASATALDVPTGEHVRHVDIVLPKP